jgi:adhesin transport system outer membrane protein
MSSKPCARPLANSHRRVAGRPAVTGQPGRLAAQWLLLAVTALPVLTWAACVDEDSFETPATAPAAPAATALPPEPRTQLLNLVNDALVRSNGLGAARLLAEATEQDIEEARAARKPQASLMGSVAPALISASTVTGGQLQVNAGVSISQTIYDGGRGERMVDWRVQQSEAARLGLLSIQEQITLSTASLAFERSRFRMQAVIYGQNMRKMTCLVQALEAIVEADKGRLSELVQARKQRGLAELQQAQAVSQARQVEAKLRRMAGDGLPSVAGFSTLMLAVPDLSQVLSAAERSADIGAMDANAAGLREIARVVEASAKPQVSWNLGGSATVAGGSAALVGNSGNSRNLSLSAGVTVNIPLLNPSVGYSIQGARKRAEAATFQRAEALESRRQRIVETHEQAGAAFERVRRVALVLRDSEQLRNFTLQQWQQMGRRSLFDVIGAESEHYNLRVQYINALHDGEQMNATLTSLGPGLAEWLQ